MCQGYPIGKRKVMCYALIWIAAVLRKAVVSIDVYPGIRCSRRQSAKQHYYFL